MNEYIEQLNKLLENATNEIKQFCNENSWLNEIKNYISRWSKKLIFEWKQAGAFEIEEQLNKIRNWNDKIKNSLPTIVITKNKILKVLTTPIEKYLIPKLDLIYNEICESLISQINCDTLIFIEDITKIIQVNVNNFKNNLNKFLLKEIEDKPKSIEDFARYAKKASKYKTDIHLYEKKINLVKSLTEVLFNKKKYYFLNDFKKVLRVYFRPLNIEEEQLDTQLQETWKFFLAKIQETSVYVNTQSPTILEQLESLYNVLFFKLMNFYLK